MTLRLDAEETLLVAAAAGSPSAPPGPGIRWDRAVSLAEWHRLVPLLWQHVSSGDGAPGVPEPVAAALRQAVRDSTARNLHLRHELDQVLAVLEAAGIPVVLLKGAVLAETVYPHPGLRPMSDLDLLVPEADLERAHGLLRELGFGVAGPRLMRDERTWLAAMHHHLPLVKADGAVVIELHYRLFVDPPGLDVAGVWDRAVPAERAPAHLIPSADDLLAHVALHFTNDRILRRGGALGQLADIARVAGSAPIDWDSVTARCQAGRAGERLFLALDAADQLFGDLVPADVVAALAPPSYTPRRGEQFVRHRVLAAQPSVPLEMFAGGRRRLFPGTEGLEYYLRPDDPERPSRLRLQARRWAALGRRAASAAAHPRRLSRDIRLSRWIVSLRS